MNARRTDACACWGLGSLNTGRRRACWPHPQHNDLLLLALWQTTRLALSSLYAPQSSIAACPVTDTVPGRCRSRRPRPRAFSRQERSPSAHHQQSGRPPPRSSGPGYPGTPPPAHMYRVAVALTDRPSRAPWKCSTSSACCPSCARRARCSSPSSSTSSLGAPRSCRPRTSASRRTTRPRSHTYVRPPACVLNADSPPRSSAEQHVPGGTVPHGGHPPRAPREARLRRGVRDRAGRLQAVRGPRRGYHEEERGRRGRGCDAEFPLACWR